MARALGVARFVEEAADDGPEWVGVGRLAVVLFEVEGARPVRRAGSEGVAERGGAGVYEGSVGVRERIVAEVAEDVQGLDGRAVDRVWRVGEGVLLGMYV